MKLNIKKNKNYSTKSGDKNKIHFDKKFTLNYSIKKPICHGTNIATELLKKLKRKISSVKFTFQNPVYVNEKLVFKIYKNRAKIVANKETKVIAQLKYGGAEIDNISLKKHLDNISKTVGNHNYLRCPSLILSIDIDYNKKKFNSKVIKKLKKNIYNLNYYNSNINSNTVFAKLQRKPKIIFKKKIKKKKLSKVLIFGENSDLGNYTGKYLTSQGYQVFYFKKYFTHNMVLNKKKLNKYKKIDFKYIFYFISTKIIPFKKQYDFENYNIFKFICDFFSKNKNCKIFFPSTKFINEKKSEYFHYIKSKLKTENLIKKLQNNNIKFYRLPKFKTSQTYNLFGKYEGKNLTKINSYINKFISD